MRNHRSFKHLKEFKTNYGSLNSVDAMIVVACGEDNDDGDTFYSY